jgi:hypothetical protein
MSDQVLALLSTAGWVVLVGVILALFGTTEGGAWSIAGSVARGVRDWAGNRAETSAVSVSGAALSSSSHGSDPALVASPTAETEDL